MELGRAEKGAAFSTTPKFDTHSLESESSSSYPEIYGRLIFTTLPSIFIFAAAGESR